MLIKWSDHMNHGLLIIEFTTKKIKLMYKNRFSGEKEKKRVTCNHSSESLAAAYLLEKGVRVYGQWKWLKGWRRRRPGGIWSEMRTIWRTGDG